MSADRSYAARNDAERARLEARGARCSDADLARPMDAGWTVAGVLAHLAFWDQRILELLHQWETKGIAPRMEIETDVDWINDAGKPLLLAIAPRKAAELTVAIARETDRRVAELPDALIAKNAAAGGPVNLSRADHRRAHLNDIERVLR